MSGWVRRVFLILLEYRGCNLTICALTFLVCLVRVQSKRLPKASIDWLTCYLWMGAQKASCQRCLASNIPHPLTVSLLLQGRFRFFQTRSWIVWKFSFSSCLFGELCVLKGFMFCVSHVLQISRPVQFSPFSEGEDNFACLVLHIPDRRWAVYFGSEDFYCWVFHCRHNIKALILSNRFTSISVNFSRSGV